MRAPMLALFVGLLTLAPALNDKKIVCYLNTIMFCLKRGEYDISSIDPSLCTHVIYMYRPRSFSECGRIDADLLLYDNNLDSLINLRKINPETKFMMSIGGWEEGGVRYSKMASNPILRKIFVADVVAFIRKHGFDGFDVYWAYPTYRGGDATDRQSYVTLLRELREKFDEEGLILSVAVNGLKEYATAAYDIPEIVKYPHFINFMAIDIHRSYEPRTGITAPLYARWWQNQFEPDFSVSGQVRYWLDKGAPAEKLVLCVPFCGRGFTLVNAANHEIDAPAAGESLPGSYTRTPGTLGYNEICQKILNEGWKVTFQTDQRAPYATGGDQWVGYDDPRSIDEKAEYVKAQGLGGMAAWTLETDDSRGLCGEKYPLLKAIHKALRDPPVAAN